METEEPVSVALELRRLTEVVTKLTSEFEAHSSLLTRHCNECKGMIDEVRTSHNELKSKLLEDSKIYVIGDVSAYQNQPTTVHSQESSSLGSAKDDLMNQQQTLECDANVVVAPAAATTHDQFSEISSQTNMKLIQLVEAAAIHVARENMQRGTPTENIINDNQEDIKTTPSQVVPETGSLNTCDKRLCFQITPSPSNYPTDNDYRNQQRRAKVDDLKGTPTNSTSYAVPLRTPPEKILRCEFCPRLFEHHHSAVLHMRSCKKIHDENHRIREQAQHNNFKDLIAVGQEMDEEGGSRRSRTKRSMSLSGQKMIKCGHCERTFPTQHQVSSHERVHTGLRPYSCHVCGVKFAHGGNMIKHIKSKHPSENPYMCRYCQNNFKTHADVLQHRKLCAVHRALLKDRSESSINRNKSKMQGRQGEETVTASEDENSGPPTANLPSQSSFDTRPLESSSGLVPPTPLLAIKTESLETEVTPPTLPSSFGDMRNFNCDKSGTTLENLETDTSVDPFTVAANQFKMVEVKEEVDFLPD